MIATIDGIERIRFTSPHPSDTTESLIEAMATESKVMPQLHLPIQSGSDRILAAMERGYTVAEYLELVARVRAAIPGVAISTDIIVGFHGEEESDFEATTAIMREVGYDSAFMFKYSVREHTRAFRLGDSVSEEEKGRRLIALIALQEEMSLARNRAMIGREFPVLVEGAARRGARHDVGQDAAVQDRNFCRRRGNPRRRYRQRARRFRDRPFADVLGRVMRNIALRRKLAMIKTRRCGPYCVGSCHSRAHRSLYG